MKTVIGLARAGSTEEFRELAKLGAFRRRSLGIGWRGGRSSLLGT